MLLNASRATRISNHTAVNVSEAQENAKSALETFDIYYVKIFHLQLKLRSTTNNERAAKQEVKRILTLLVQETENTEMLHSAHHTYCQKSRRRDRLDGKEQQEASC